MWSKPFVHQKKGRTWELNVSFRLYGIVLGVGLYGAGVSAFPTCVIVGIFLVAYYAHARSPQKTSYSMVKS